MERNQNGKYCVRIQVHYPRHAWDLSVYFLAGTFDRAMKKLEQGLDFLQRHEEKLWFWGVDRAEDLGFSAEFLKEAGLSPDALVLTDGSGLSRNDMVTAEATVRLLTYMNRHKYAAVWRNALPIAGVDGTLRNRLKGTAAENNLRAKTGTLSSAASLSGYVTSAAGENLVFSIMVNNYPEDVDPRTVCIDPIAVLLASFAGRP